MSSMSGLPWTYADVTKAYRTARARGMPCAEAHTNVLEAATRRGLNVTRCDKILKGLVLDDRESASLFGPPTQEDLREIYRRLGVQDK